MFNLIIGINYISRIGLAYRFANLLKKASNDYKDIMINTINEFIKNSHHEKDTSIFLKRLTGDNYCGSSFHASNITCSTVCYYLLFDGKGNQELFVKDLNWEDIEKIKFPLDPYNASRLAKLIIQNCELENPIKQLKPYTEIQKQLLLRYMQEADSKSL